MEKKPKGLGGWLILFQVGFILILISSISIWFSAISVLEGAIRIIYILFGLFLFLATLFLMDLFYHKRKSFVKWQLRFIWGFFFLGVLFWALEKFLFSSSISDGLYEILFSLMGCIIWSAYLKESERVKNTFVK